MAIYVKIDGIEGDVTAKGYEGCFEALSVSHEVKRQVSNQVGHVINRQISKPIIDGFILTKLLDKTSPLLHIMSAYSQPKSKVTISFVKTDKNLSPYLIYTLNDSYISHYKIHAASLGSTAGAAIEHIELSPAKFESKFTPYDKTGSAGTPIGAGYDLESATTC